MPHTALLLVVSCAIIAGSTLHQRRTKQLPAAPAEIMGHTVATIIPIFGLVAVGSIARQRGFLPQAFLVPANRLVYYLATPAMIFRAVSGAFLTLQFSYAFWLSVG